MNREFLISMAYIVSAFCFSYGLKMMSSPARARRGNLLSSLGMLLAVAATLLGSGVLTFKWLVVGLVVGSAAGAVIALRAAMTQMPQMVALLNGSGGLASLLVGWAEYHPRLQVSFYDAVTVFITVLIGGVTFTGSMVAWGKLDGVIPSKPILYPWQKAVNAALFSLLLVGGAVFCLSPVGGAAYPLFVLLIAFSLLLGVLAVISIGGADMPVVISLLNSYSGMAACAAGFVVQNHVLIVTGALVGASGIILTQIMCKAMNRSLGNVLFSGFGSKKTGSLEIKGEAKSASVSDAYVVMEAARNVVFVPGYGLAVAQAQHALRELGELLEENGAQVRYAIHPVAGRMPGHMNVLLAEANVSYDQLVEMDDVNPTMSEVDVCVIVGANDVVNPAARQDKGSPIYGMPIIDADKARNVYVLKRSMASGFSGVENPLFFGENVRMVFGDAKATIQELAAEFKSAKKQ